MDLLTFGRQKPIQAIELRKHLPTLAKAELAT
jgi:hypothetical protein